MMETLEQMEKRHRRERKALLAGREPRPSNIIYAYACSLGMSVKEFKAPNRARSIAHARQECMAELRRRTSLSLPQIGRMLGRDHTTVLHALRAVEGRAE